MASFRTPECNSGGRLTADAGVDLPCPHGRTATVNWGFSPRRRPVTSASLLFVPLRRFRRRGCAAPGAPRPAMPGGGTRTARPVAIQPHRPRPAPGRPWRGFAPPGARYARAGGFCGKAGHRVGKGGPGIPGAERARRAQEWSLSNPCRAVGAAPMPVSRVFRGVPGTRAAAQRSLRIAVVFTAKSVERILKEGGTSSWRLDRNHARQCAFAVCTRNAHADWTEGPEPHHTAFLIGKIKDVVPSPTHEGRFLIEFSDYAPLNIPDAWHGGRNPVSYGTTQDLGIDLALLKWESMPETITPAAATHLAHATNGRTGPLTIADAKQGLAETFGVSPEAVEITIRG